jgi:hypothetical protein
MISEKVIIENRTDQPLWKLLDKIKTVLHGGKISKTSKGEQYCFTTIWADGIYVFADKNKKSDRLIIGYRKEYES